MIGLSASFRGRLRRPSRRRDLLPAGRAGKPASASLAALLSLLLTIASAAAQDPSSGARVADEFARPALAALLRSAEATAGAVEALCREPAQPALERARAAFAQTVGDWGRASVLRFGPLAAENRFERIFFWPDPRGIALRQVQQVLAERDENAATATGVAQKSVALQGLPALEFALFGTGSEALAGGDGGFRCRYAAAVSRNVADLAGQAHDGWRADGPFATAFTRPSAATEPYRSQAEADGEIVKALSTAFQFVRAAELLPPLGEEPAKANGRRAPLWRSGLSFGLMAAQAEGARALLRAAGYAETLPEDMRWVADSIEFELDNAMRALGAVEALAEQAFGQEEDRGRLTFADLALDHAGHLVSEQLSAALGLTMGFNALDGD